MTGPSTHHTATITCELVDRNAPTGRLLKVLGGTVTVDRDAAIRRTLDLTIADIDLIPTSVDSTLFPSGIEIRVDRGWVNFGADTGTITQGVFRVESVLPTAGGIRIAGYDRSAKIIDARLENPWPIIAGQRISDAIEALILDADPSATTRFVPTVDTTPLVVLDTGADRWEWCLRMARAAGMELYVDRTGTFRLEPEATLAENEAWQLTDSRQLLAAEKEWTREGLYNAVVVIGTATQSADPPRGFATIDTGVLAYVGAYGKKPKVVRSEFVTTALQAEQLAQSILGAQFRYDQAAVWTSVVDPRVDVGDTIRLDRSRLGIAELHIVDTLTIPLTPATPMTGTSTTSRFPDIAPTLGRAYIPRGA